MIGLLEIAVFAVVCIWCYSRNSAPAGYGFGREELAVMESEEGFLSAEGKLDETCEAGVYSVVPGGAMPDLRRYSWYFVTYEIKAENTAGSFCWLYSYEEQEDTEGEAVYLKNGLHEYSETFLVSGSRKTALLLYYDGAGEIEITGFQMKEVPANAGIRCFLCLALLLAGNAVAGAVYLFRKKPMSAKSRYVLIALSAAALIAGYPYLVNNTYSGHDMLFHLIRIEGIKDGILSGQFPVRINPSFYKGYGYANPVFYGEILLYIPALLRLLGMPLYAAYNFYVLLINALTCGIGYWCFQKMFRNETTATVLSVIYVFAPYRMVDICRRASAGEYSAMAFLPLVIYGLYKIYSEDMERPQYRWSFLPLMLGLTGLVQTHVITGEMTGGFIFLTCLFLLPKTLEKKRLIALGKAVVVTVGVNLWFLIPFMDYTLTQKARIFGEVVDPLMSRDGTFPAQLMTLFFNYQGYNQHMSEGIQGEMPLVLGLGLVLGVVLTFGLWFAGEEEDKKRRRAGWIILLLTGITVFLSTVWFPWDGITRAVPQLEKLLASVQFPWRFLTLSTVLAAAAAGYGLEVLYRKKEKAAYAAAATALVLLTVAGSMYFMQDYVEKAQIIRPCSAKSVDTIAAAIGGEYLTEDANVERMEENTAPAASQGVTFTGYGKNGTSIQLEADGGEEGGNILLPLLYYKGYEVRTEDGRIGKEALSPGEDGLVQIAIPSGYEGKLWVEYTEPWYWRLAEIFSILLTVFLFTAYRKQCRNARLGG